MTAITSPIVTFWKFRFRANFDLGFLLLAQGQQGDEVK